MSTAPTTSRPTRVRFVERLAEHGEATALSTGDRTISYADLAGRVEHAAAELGATRRLVLQPMRTDLESVVGYLAAIAGGHPVLVTEDRPDLVESLRVAWRPDVIDGHGPTEHHPATSHDLHPELSLLLSTSGSTGSPRLVRLSADAVNQNALAIADFLGLESHDVAITTLPLHYCYGLSVLHSHLACGASVHLTDLSVVDPCFWEQVEERAITTIAGVPHTFDLLDRSGFADRDHSSLRRLTCAGGRLSPPQVRRYADLGARSGFDLVVMYGQTEATARMAWLPPDLAQTHADTVGLAIPGGRLRVDAPNEQGVGELVYDGPNVMLGYAETEADLARGRDVDELRTGDLARMTDAGLVQLVGRASRLAKLFGLRIDLDRLEEQLGAAGHRGWCVATEERLVVGLEGPVSRAAGDRVLRDLVARTGIPEYAIAVVAVEELPRTSSDKPDRRRLLAMADPAVTPAPTGPRTVGGLYRELLGRPAAATDSFVSLGGDSLSYVEASIRLESLLGDLPSGWHQRPVCELEELRRGGASRRTAAVEVTVPLRAVAILVIVGGHVGLWSLQGGAHVLLALAGFNLARFQLATHGEGGPRAILAAARRIAVPSALWIAAAAVVLSGYAWFSPLLLNAVVGPAHWSEPVWWYWFIEALVALLLATALLLAVPPLAAAERRQRFWFPIAVVGLGALFRYDVVSLRDGVEIYRAENLVWLFALGWATAQASRRSERVLVSLLAVGLGLGFFDSALRTAMVVGGVLALAWLPTIRLPRPVARATAWTAGASLTIYLTHWQIHPPLEQVSPVLAFTVSIVGGIAIWLLARRLHAASALVRRVTG